MWLDHTLAHYLNSSSFISVKQIPHNTVLLYEVQNMYQEKHTMMCHQKGWIVDTDYKLREIINQWLKDTLYQPLAFQYAFKTYFNRRYKHLPFIAKGDIWLPIIGTVFKNDYCWVNILSMNKVVKEHYGSLCYLSSYQPLHIPIHPESLHEKVRKALWMYREVVRLAEQLSVIHKELLFYDFWHVNDYIEKQYQYILKHSIKYPYLDLDTFYRYYIDYQKANYGKE